MLTKILLSAVLVGPAPVVGTTNPGEEALQSVRELYTYATQSVAVEQSEVQRMVEEIRSRLGETPDGSREALESLVAAAEQPDPNGREIRVHARELYRTLVDGQT